MVTTFKRECLDSDAPKGQLVQVPFHGDVLEAWGTCEADAEVSIRRVCENLGVSTEGQLKKLKSKRWACVNLKFMQVEGDSQAREVATIPLKKLPMWLTNIEPRRVKPEFRAKLERYQEEAADVLARHFLRPAANAGQSPGVAREVEMVRGELAQVQNRLDAMPATLAEIVSRTMAEVLTRAEVAPLLCTETVASRLGKLLPHWNTTVEQRALIRNRARANVKRALGQEPLCVHAGSQLEFTPNMVYHLDTAIYQTYRQALRDNEVDDYGLYRDDV